MAHIDNEYHRLASDCGPTLEQLPPTLGQSEPEQPKTNRRAKAWAMKLITAIATVAVVFTVVTGRVPSWQGLKDWPKLDATDSDFSYAVSAMSKNSSSVQFAMGPTIYRLTASGSDLCFLWLSSFGMDYEGSYNSAHLQVESRTEGWACAMILSNHDDEKKSPDCAYGTISTADGQLLYLEAISSTGDNGPINSREELQRFVSRFVTNCRIDLGTDSGWGKLLVGKTMYSDIYEYWTGMQYRYLGATWDFDVNYSYAHDLTEADKVDTQTVNGIEWTFYYKLSTVSGNTEMMLWAVPSQEDGIAFGVTQSEMEGIRYNYRRPEPRGGVEDEEGDWMPPPMTAEEMVNIISQQLVCYHLITDGI